MIFHSYVSLPEGNETNISTLESTSTPRDATRFAPNAAKEGMRTEQQTRDETFWPTERLVDLSWQLLPVDPLWIKTAVSQCPSGRNFRSVFFFWIRKWYPSHQPPAQDVSEACLECAQCTEPTSTELVEGLQLTGAWVPWPSCTAGNPGNSYTQCE